MKCYAGWQRQLVWPRRRSSQLCMFGARSATTREAWGWCARTTQRHYDLFRVLLAVYTSCYIRTRLAPLGTAADWERARRDPFFPSDAAGDDELGQIPCAWLLQRLRRAKAAACLPLPRLQRVHSALRTVLLEALLLHRAPQPQDGPPLSFLASPLLYIRLHPHIFPRPHPLRPAPQRAPLPCRVPLFALTTILLPSSYLRGLLSIRDGLRTSTARDTATRRPVDSMRDDPPRYLRGARLGGPTPSLSLVVVDGTGAGQLCSGSTRRRCVEVREWAILSFRYVLCRRS
jgi:hypothetical protein